MPNATSKYNRLSGVDILAYPAKLYRRINFISRMASQKIEAVFKEGSAERVTKITVTFFPDKKNAPTAAAVPPIQPSKRQLTDINDEAAQSKKGKEDGELRRRKLNFLGHCLYEYIQRAQYCFNEHITEKLILQRAIKFFDLMGMDGFTPNMNWIKQVMAAYKVTLPQRPTTIAQRPPTSMDLRNIMSFCGQQTSLACNLLSNSPEAAPLTTSDQRGIERPLNTSCQNQANLDGILMRRKRKIMFLEKCLYEYIQRSQVHHKGRLNMDNLRIVAIRLRDILKIDSFFPDKTWFNHFKHNYNFTVPVTNRQLPHSLDLLYIINYCSQQLLEAKSTIESPKTPNESLKPGAKETPTELIDIKDEDKNNASGSIKKPIKRKMDDNSKHSFSEIKKVHHFLQQPQPFNYNDSVKTEVTETAPPPSFKDALRLLKPLEDFALMRENYRVIGLLSQLEQIFEAGKKAEEMGSSIK